LTNSTVTVNTTIQITCKAQANPPAKYHFFKNLVSIRNDTSGSNVSVITIQVKERIKQVNYGCTPCNDFGCGPTQVAKVTVLCKYFHTTISTALHHGRDVSNVILLPGSHPERNPCSTKNTGLGSIAKTTL